MPAVSQSCSLIRFRRAPLPILTILDENSTPMVCEERTLPEAQKKARSTRTRSLSTTRGILHSFFTKRWSKHDLENPQNELNILPLLWCSIPALLLSRTTWTNKNHFREIIIHTLEFLFNHPPRNRQQKQNEKSRAKPGKSKSN